MYKSKVYLIRENEKNPIALEESGYINEDSLQELIERFPDLIPGDQIDPEDPRRWLLVAREMGVPGDADESDRWSLDHLLLDQDGIPTFVECKRASDTRIRREVVAQMLDYAANGVEYWDLDRIRQSAAETAQRDKKSLDEEVAHLLGEDSDPERIDEYWRGVAANLKDRRIRLVFVSDSTPKELRRLVEFLNEEMSNVEVLAVEIKRYAREGDESHQAIVPRVIGATEAARSRKTESSRRQNLTPEQFFAKCSPEAQKFFQQVVDKSSKRGHTLIWGQKALSIRGKVGREGRLVSFIYAIPPDQFQFYFDGHAVFPREKSSPLRTELDALGIFKPSGEYTLTTSVSEVGIERLTKILDLILDKMDSYLPNNKSGEA
jgi:hypothetical protein